MTYPTLSRIVSFAGTIRCKVYVLFFCLAIVTWRYF
nr:MAG TPA: hypothetical protein [Caudoviricetes sp.]